MTSPFSTATATSHEVAVGIPSDLVARDKEGTMLDAILISCGYEWGSMGRVDRKAVFFFDLM